MTLETKTFFLNDFVKNIASNTKQVSGKLLEVFSLSIIFVLLFVLLYKYYQKMLTYLTKTKCMYKQYQTS